jgi:hypothetical protein
MKGNNYSQLISVNFDMPFGGAGISKKERN